MQLWKIQSALSTPEYAVSMNKPGTGGGLTNLNISIPSLTQFWQLSTSGQLLSALSSKWAVTANPTSNAVTVQPVASNSPAQIWQLQSVDSYQALVNQQTGMALTGSYSESVFFQAPLADQQGQKFSLTNPFASDYWMLTTVTNNTPNDLSISGTAEEGSSALTQEKLPLVSGASLTFWSYYNSGLATVAQIWAPRLSSPVATFTVHLNWRDSTWISDDDANNGYSISQTGTTDPPDSTSPALATVSLSYSG